MDITIEELNKKDAAEAYHLLTEVIIDNWKTEGIDINKFKKELQGELQGQKDRLDGFCIKGLPYYLVAKYDEEIVGVIAYGPNEKPIKLALKKLKKSEESMVEVMASYVELSFQRKGIGTKLFNSILEKIKKDDYKYFSLTTGYKKGLKFWSKKLGKPDIILKNYFGEGVHFWVWIRGVYV